MRNFYINLWEFLMLTIREQLETIETAIEKVKNSQEYKISSQTNRMALLRELQSEREYLLNQITSDADLDLTLVDLQIKRRTLGGRSYIGFI